MNKINTRILCKRDTTENWNNAVGFIPMEGEIIIYTDYSSKTYTVEEDGKEVTKTKFIPGIKIGTGNSYVQDLVFVGDELREELMNHINNSSCHVTPEEKSFWSDKINIDDSTDVLLQELEDETLVFYRS